MIIIYHLEHSRSERVIWLMEELGLPYEVKGFKRTPDMRSEDAYRRIHPFGKSPMIRDGDTLLIESGAIVEYIIHRHGGGRLSVPVDSSDYAAYLQWLHFAEGSAMPQFIRSLFASGFVPGIDPSSPFAKSSQEATRDMLKFINGELKGKTYFAGSFFTVADLMMAYCFRMPQARLGIDINDYPEFVAWTQRIESRPAYKKAMAIANENTD